MGFKVTELKVLHHKRKYGKSKYGIKRFFIGLFDFFTVMFLNRYFSSPLHLFGTLGLICIFAGLFMDGYVLILRLSSGSIQNRMPLFWVAFFFLSSESSSFQSD